METLGDKLTFLLGLPSSFVSITNSNHLVWGQGRGREEIEEGRDRRGGGKRGGKGKEEGINVMRNH